MAAWIRPCLSPAMRCMAKLIEGCGCCGRIIKNSEWCKDCIGHLRIDDKGVHRAPWDRTYFAQHGATCPFEDEKESARFSKDIEAIHIIIDLFSKPKAEGME